MYHRTAQEEECLINSPTAIKKMQRNQSAITRFYKTCTTQLPISQYLAPSFSLIFIIGHLFRCCPHGLYQVCAGCGPNFP
jgi:hypothetical protein